MAPGRHAHAATAAPLGQRWPACRRRHVRGLPWAYAPDVKDVAIIGLPSAGKTTVFEAVVRTHLGYGERREHVAVIEVPDDRVCVLARMYGSAKATHARLRLHDVPGLDARSIAMARTADALACVLRAFGPSSDPARDLAAVRTELAVHDLATVEHVKERAARRARAGEKDAAAELEAAARAEAVLGEGRWLSEEAWSAEAERLVRLWTPLTMKPMLRVINADESWEETCVDGPAVLIRAQLEAEAADLPPEDAAELLRAYGIEGTATDTFVRGIYEALELVTFFTANEHEARAWAVGRGARAPQAAGVVHSDFERGFIRAERVSFDDLVRAGSPDAAKRSGLVRLEGKDYEVREGDVLFIRHS